MVQRAKGFGHFSSYNFRCSFIKTLPFSGGFLFFDPQAALSRQKARLKPAAEPAAALISFYSQPSVTKVPISSPAPHEPDYPAGQYQKPAQGIWLSLHMEAAVTYPLPPILIEHLEEKVRVSYFTASSYFMGGSFIVHAIHHGCFHHNLRADFRRTQRGCRVGGKKRITGSTAKNHDPSLLRWRTARLPHIRLCHLLHCDSGQ